MMVRVIVDGVTYITPSSCESGKEGILFKRTVIFWNRWDTATISS